MMGGVPALKGTEWQATFSGDSCPFPVLGFSHRALPAHVHRTHVHFCVHKHAYTNINTLPMARVYVICSLSQVISFKNLSVPA